MALLTIWLYLIRFFISRYQLMLKCWSYRPEERPTFRYCLDVLQSLRTKFEDIRINLENASRNFTGKPLYNTTFFYSSLGHRIFNNSRFHYHFNNLTYCLNALFVF